MTALTRKVGETIDLGGGAVVTVTGVGRRRVSFRAALPAGVSLRQSVRPRPSRSTAVGRLRPGKAQPWSIGFLVYPGGTALIGDVIRLTVKTIEDPGKIHGPRVAHIAVEGQWPPAAASTPRPVSPVRPIDELTPEELARAVGWKMPEEKGEARPKRAR